MCTTRHRVLITSATNLQDLVGRISLVAVEESVVHHVTGALPVERQLHHLRWKRRIPLCEALQRGVLQHSVVTNPTQQVDLKEEQWRPEVRKDYGA